jgi:hypothetical protein
MTQYRNKNGGRWDQKQGYTKKYGKKNKPYHKKIMYYRKGYKKTIRAT